MRSPVRGGRAVFQRGFNENVQLRDAMPTFGVVFFYGAATVRTQLASATRGIIVGSRALTTSLTSDLGQDQGPGLIIFSCFVNSLPRPL